jgi:hypothetical protein
VEDRGSSSGQLDIRCEECLIGESKNIERGIKLGLFGKKKTQDKTQPKPPSTNGEATSDCNVTFEDRLNLNISSLASSQEIQNVKDLLGRQSQFSAHFIANMALIMTSDQSVKNYEKLLSDSGATAPARNRKMGGPRGSIADIWEDTIIEALTSFWQWKSGTNLIFSLGDFGKQPPALSKFKGLLRGNKIKIEPEELDDAVMTAHYVIRRWCEVLDGLLSEIPELRQKWYQTELFKRIDLADEYNQKMINNTLGPSDIVQPTLFEIIFEEIAYISKSITLVSIYGTDFDKAMDAMKTTSVEMMQKSGKTEEKIKDFLFWFLSFRDSIKASKRPWDIRKIKFPENGN